VLDKNKQRELSGAWEAVPIFGSGGRVSGVGYYDGQGWITAGHVVERRGDHPAGQRFCISNSVDVAVIGRPVRPTCSRQNVPTGRFVVYGRGGWSEKVEASLYRGRSNIRLFRGVSGSPLADEEGGLIAIIVGRLQEDHHQAIVVGCRVIQRVWDDCMSPWATGRAQVR